MSNAKEEINLKELNLKKLIEKETGKKFNKDNKICCPFHNEKTSSFSIRKYDDKWRYNCFGCGQYGDAIDFIKEYKHIHYVDACKYLNIDPGEDYSKRMALIEKVEKAIDEINFKDKDTGDSLKYMYTNVFVDQLNNPIYFEARFKNSSNKSESRFLSSKDNKIVPERGSDAVPYNLYKLLEGLKNQKDIFILEGAKDANTLYYMGYTTTSFKGVTKFDYSLFQDVKVYIIPDTGAAGEKYKDDLYYKLKEYVKEFNVIYPKGLSELGINKDITDWFQSGKSLDDFKAELIDKWDYIKNRNYKYVTSDGKPKMIWQNLNQLFIKNNIVIKYNELLKKVEYVGSIFDIPKDNKSSSEDIYSYCHKINFNIKKYDLKDFLYRISQANAYNPVKNYLDDCYKNWDHKEGYIQQLADSIVTPNDYDDSFKLILLKKWLIGTAKMAFNDGTDYMNGMLIIQGDQGIGKTRWIKTLSPNKNWILTDQNVNPRKVDDVVRVTGAWITELGEIKESVNKNTSDSMKTFLTKSTDIYRRPYAPNDENYPRVTSFYGTVNDKEFLCDPTGNRRFFTIRAIKMIVEHDIDINKLWGEVMFLWKDAKVIDWLTDEELKHLYIINSNFEIKTEADNKLIDSFDWNAPNDKWIYKTLTDICYIIGIKGDTNAKTALTNLGAIPPPNGKNFRVKGYKGAQKWWKIPPLTSIHNEMDKPIENIIEDIQQTLQPKESTIGWSI